MTDIISDTQYQEFLLFSNRTLIHLKSAMKEIESAGNWGFFDNLTGGLFSPFTKKGSIKNIHDELIRAKEEAVPLREVIDKMQFYLGMIPIENFITFSDSFFDDYVESFSEDEDLDQARIKIKKAIGEIESMQMFFALYFK